MDNNSDSNRPWGEAEDAARRAAGLHQKGSAPARDTAPADTGSAVGSPAAADPVDRIHEDVPGFVDAGDPDVDGPANSSIEG